VRTAFILTVRILLLFGVAVSVFAQQLWLRLQQHRHRTTRLHIEEIAHALDWYHSDHRQLPAVNTVRELRSFLEPRYSRHLPSVDGWGNEILYHWSGTSIERGDYGYDLVSPGADGKLAPETARIIAVPHSDPEASGNASLALINSTSRNGQYSKRWFEYLDEDIVFNGTFIRDQPLPEFCPPGTAPGYMAKAGFVGALVCVAAFAAITIHQRRRRESRAGRGI
jgi:hypothetical protein